MIIVNDSKDDSKQRLSVKDISVFYELQGVKKISLTTWFLPCIIAFVA